MPKLIKPPLDLVHQRVKNIHLTMCAQCDGMVECHSALHWQSGKLLALGAPGILLRSPWEPSQGTGSQWQGERFTGRLSHSRSHMAYIRLRWRCRNDLQVAFCDATVTTRAQLFAFRDIGIALGKAGPHETLWKNGREKQ